jgi:hypothetical protein
MDFQNRFQHKEGRLLRPLVKRGLFLSLFIAGSLHGPGFAVADTDAVRNGATTFASLQAAYDVASTGDTILSRAITFYEGLNLSRDINVTINGGFNADFTANANGATSLTGPLIISAGSTTVSRIAFAGNEAKASGMIVPLYSWPTEWPAIILAALAHPAVSVVAIINQTAIGPPMPPQECSEEWSDGIVSLKNAGITVIAYVDTNYTMTDVTTVKTRINRWNECYPGLGGVMFDQMDNNEASIGYYKEVSDYAKSTGLAFTVANPGADTPVAFFNGATADAFFVYESPGLPNASDFTKYQPFRSQSAVIPLEVPGSADTPGLMSAAAREWVRAVKQYCKYIYLTDDVMDNPWDNLSSYIDDLMRVLEEP